MPSRAALIPSSYNHVSTVYINIEAAPVYCGVDVGKMGCVCVSVKIQRNDERWNRPIPLRLQTLYGVARNFLLHSLLPLGI